MQWKAERPVDSIKLSQMRRLEEPGQGQRRRPYQILLQMKRLE